MKASSASGESPSEVELKAPSSPKKIAVPKVAKRLNDAARATIDQTQSRFVVGLLRGYFKSFILNWDPKMLSVKTNLKGLTLSFPDPAGFEMNCAAVNSLYSPSWSESQFLSRCVVKELTFTVTLGAGMTFTTANMTMKSCEFVICREGQKKPRLPPDIEARLLEEWYGPNVNPNSAAARVSDGCSLSIGTCVVRWPGAWEMTVQDLLSVSVDHHGQECGLPQCWYDDAAQSTRRIRKRVTVSTFQIDAFVLVPAVKASQEAPRASSGSGKGSGNGTTSGELTNDDDTDDEGVDPTQPPVEVRAPWLQEARVNFDLCVTKKLAATSRDGGGGCWLDVDMTMDQPHLGFLFGNLPMRVNTRPAPPPPPVGVNQSAGNPTSHGPGVNASSSSTALAKNKPRGCFGGLFACCSSGSSNTDGGADTSPADPHDTTPAASSLTKGRSQSKIQEGFLCPECMVTFHSGEALSAHFEASHPLKKSNARGSARDATSGSGGDGGSGLGEWGEQGLKDLEAAAVEPSLAALAVFADGLDLFDDAFLDVSGDDGSGQGEEARTRLGVPKLLALAQDLEAATKLGQMGLVDGFTAAEEGTEQFWRNVAGDGAVDKVKAGVRRIKTDVVHAAVTSTQGAHQVLVPAVVHGVGDAVDYVAADLPEHVGAAALATGGAVHNLSQGKVMKVTSDVGQGVSATASSWGAAMEGFALPLRASVSGHLNLAAGQLESDLAKHAQQARAHIQGGLTSTHLGSSV